MFCCWGTKYSLYSHDALYSYVWPEGVTLQMCMVKKGKKKRKEEILLFNTDCLVGSVWPGNIFHISTTFCVLRQHCIGKESAFVLFAALA